MQDTNIQNENGIIATDKFTIKPSSNKKIESYLNSHLGESLIEIISIGYYTAECNVKTEAGEKIVNISLPANIIHHTQSNKV